MQGFKKTYLAGLITLALAGAAHAGVSDENGVNTSRDVKGRAASVTLHTGEVVQYTIVDGYAMVGDMIIGRHDEIQHTRTLRQFIGNWQQPVVEKRKGQPPSDNHAKGSTRWPNNTVYYTFASNFSQRGRDAVRAGMKLITDRTAIQFKERTNERNYVEFYPGGGCSSWVGMVGGRQQISLGSGCEYAGIAAHEMLHALGWNHEQMRPDRDNYVNIHSENIPSNVLYNFNKVRDSDADPVGPYDFRSIMHYDAYAFSSNGRPTITPKDSSIPLSNLGQRRALSDGDATSVNKFYPGATTPTDIKITISASELRLDENTKGELVLDMAGPADDLRTISFRVSSDNLAVVATNGIRIEDAMAGNQRYVVVSPQPNAYGVTNVTLVATSQSGKQATVRFKVTVLD
uniref:M12 family metallopeptidase n=1 Tax=Chitinivorax sp. B TaxID=2502235 RepID=UPI001484E17E